ncbi:MAG: hypothetical protein ACAH83_20375 [Alphaproteobacteria bacterium]
MGKGIDIILTNDETEVRRLVSEGYCPVECSINGHSIVDSLVMDHHEDRSHLEAVSVRAVRDHAGARADDPRFVVVGACDADAAYAVAALSGLIPQNKATLTLGETIGIMDTEPIGRDLLKMPYGDYLAVWFDGHERTRTNRTQQGAIDAVFEWQKIAAALDTPDAAMQKRLRQARDNDAHRVEAAQQDLSRATIENGVCLMPHSDVFGFDVWYGRNEDAPADTCQGWKNQVVVIYNKISKTAAVACPNKKVAEELFGEGGLRNVFGKLQGGTWGGRESIGGSPRGKPMTLEDAQAAFERVVALVAERRPSSKASPSPAKPS